MSFQCRICKNERQDYQRANRRRNKAGSACEECLEKLNDKRRDARGRGLRWCSLCETAKRPGEFTKTSPAYLSSYCRTCSAAKMKSYKHTIREQVTHKTCTKCKKSKPVEEIAKNNNDRSVRCKECEALRSAMGRTTNQTKFSSARSSAERRGIDWTLALSDYVALRQNPCHYCGWPLPDGGGLDRLDGKSGYVAGNVIPCCTECNIARNSLFSPEEMLIIGRAVAEVKAARVTSGGQPSGVRRVGRPKKYNHVLDAAHEQVPKPPVGESGSC